MFKTGWFQRWGGWVALAILALIVVGVSTVFGPAHLTSDWFWLILSILNGLGAFAISIVSADFNILKTLARLGFYLGLLCIYVVVLFLLI